MNMQQYIQLYNSADNLLATRAGRSAGTNFSPPPAGRFGKPVLFRLPGWMADSIAGVNGEIAQAASSQSIGCLAG